jgi:hypothetical protein
VLLLLSLSLSLSLSCTPVGKLIISELTLKEEFKTIPPATTVGGEAGGEKVCIECFLCFSCVYIYICVCVCVVRVWYVRFCLVYA